MNSSPPPSLPAIASRRRRYNTAAPLSLDSYIESLAVGNVKIVTVTGDLDDPLIASGDILILDECSDPTCNDSTLLLIHYQGRYMLRQKKYIKAQLRRSNIREVGKPSPSGLEVVGRVIGWLHR